MKEEKNNSVTALEYKYEILNYIENSKMKEAHKYIEAYISNNSNDMDIYIIKSIFLMKLEKLDEAEKILLDINKKFALNFDVNYNLGELYKIKKEYHKSIRYFIRCSMILPDEINITEILEELNVSLSEYDLIKNDVKFEFEQYWWSFPATYDYKDNYYGKSVHRYNNNYIAGIYDYYHFERDKIYLESNNYIASRLQKCEIYKALETNNYEFKANEETILPIMLKGNSKKINLNIDGFNHTIENLLPNRYYYYKIDKNSFVKIESEELFICGNPIDLSHKKGNKKLILNIFVDGLSKKYIDDNGIEVLMPNTYEFFKGGISFENCYTTGDWTKTSIASVFTGKNVNTHNFIGLKGMGSQNSIYDSRLYTENLSKNGYLNTMIHGNHMNNPLDGYIESIDRCIYQISKRGMYVEDVVLEAIEHLDVFSKRDNFLWLCVFDLHDMGDDYEIKMSAQINKNIKFRKKEIVNSSSVMKPYSKTRKDSYRQQISRIDKRLNILYDYIKSNYKDDEIIVSLMSDHGQGYLYDEDYHLHEQRTKVPFMIRDTTIEQKKSYEILQVNDIFPTILKLANIENNIIEDSNLPYELGGKLRKFAYTETIHPGQEYRVAINDNEHTLYLNGLDKVNDEGRFKFDEYDVKLINKTTGEDETEEHIKKVEKYCEIVLSKIKDRIIYN